jgi:cellulose biosynthesis protein BcsQ
VDADPQFNATQYLLSANTYLKHLKDEKKGTLRDIFVPRRPGSVNTVMGNAKSINKAKLSLSACSCPIYSPGPGQGKLDLVPSTLQLIDIEASKRGTETKLKSYLRKKATGYDYVIIGLCAGIPWDPHFRLLS